MPKKKRVAVTMRAVIQRVNRKLADRMQGIRADRHAGRYLLIDLDRGVVQHDHVPIEAFARELGALKPWEELEK